MKPFQKIVTNRIEKEISSFFKNNIKMQFRFSSTNKEMDIERHLKKCRDRSNTTYKE
ncbi:hypothetical protein LLB_3722 [Legionella longbeachae D-4968]|nr:hypothetical protein LLB_3722 [Legionella longbeachae D-4968]